VIKSYQDCCEYVAHQHDEYCSDPYEERSASLMPAHSDSRSFSLLPPANITLFITTLTGHTQLHNIQHCTSQTYCYKLPSCTTATQWQTDKYWTHRSQRHCNHTSDKNHKLQPIFFLMLLTKKMKLNFISKL